MPRAATPPRAKKSAASPATIDEQAAAAMAALATAGTKKTRDGMARYAIPSDKAFGVPFAAVQKMGKALAPNHALAQALWDTGGYEARLMASFVDDPALVTAAQMDRWCARVRELGGLRHRLFKLFDRAPDAWKKVAPWSKLRDETGRRAAFVMVACLALHDKAATDAQFLRTLPIIERGAADERNFVKKAVNWALRAVGGRNAALNAAAVDVARRLAESPDAAPRWVGKDALRGRTSPPVTRRLSRRRGKGGRSNGRYCFSNTAVISMFPCGDVTSTCWSTSCRPPTGSSGRGTRCRWPSTVDKTSSTFSTHFAAVDVGALIMKVMADPSVT